VRFRRERSTTNEELRREWAELGFRAAPSSEPGFIEVAVRDEMSDERAQIEIGTAQVDDLIQLLQTAGAMAQRQLDAATLREPDA
jgi:hypothetical protein